MDQRVFGGDDFTAAQIVVFRREMRSAVMELVAGSRDTLARSRALLVEADVILRLSRSPCLGTKTLPDA